MDQHKQAQRIGAMSGQAHAVKLTRVKVCSKQRRGAPNGKLDAGLMLIFRTIWGARTGEGIVVYVAIDHDDDDTLMRLSRRFVAQLAKALGDKMCADTLEPYLNRPVLIRFPIDAPVFAPPEVAPVCRTADPLYNLLYVNT